MRPRHLCDLSVCCVVIALYRLVNVRFLIRRTHCLSAPIRWCTSKEKFVKNRPQRKCGHCSLSLTPSRPTPTAVARLLTAGMVVRARQAVRVWLSEYAGGDGAALCTAVVVVRTA